MKSRDYLYGKLSLESLADRRWSQKLFFFHEILNSFSHSYLQSYLINRTEVAFERRSSRQSKFKSFSARTKIFETSFYPYCFKEWSSLSEEIRNIESVHKFKQTILIFIMSTKKLCFCNTWQQCYQANYSS